MGMGFGEVVKAADRRKRQQILWGGDGIDVSENIKAGQECPAHFCSILREGAYFSSP